MEDIVFNQIAFVRKQTLKALDGVTELTATTLPDKFRNHILWQAGHIGLVQERFAFLIHGFDAELPEAYKSLFGPGSAPASWTESAPSLAEVTEWLRDQPQRIERQLKGRLGEASPSPYTTSSGLTLATVGEFVNFSLYHEGMHFQAIKMYKALLA